MPTKRKSEAAQNAAKRVRSSGGSERKRKREAARARGGSPKRTRFSKGDAVEYCAARSGWIPARVLRAVLDPGGNFYTIEVECAAGGRSERHTVAGRLRPAAKSASLRSRAAAAPAAVEPATPTVVERPPPLNRRLEQLSNTTREEHRRAWSSGRLVLHVLLLPLCYLAAQWVGSVDAAATVAAQHIDLLSFGPATAAFVYHVFCWVALLFVGSESVPALVRSLLFAAVLLVAALSLCASFAIYAAAFDVERAPLDGALAAVRAPLARLGALLGAAWAQPRALAALAAALFAPPLLAICVWRLRLFHLAEGNAYAARALEASASAEIFLTYIAYRASLFVHGVVRGEAAALDVVIALFLRYSGGVVGWAERATATFTTLQIGCSPTLPEALS